MTMQRHSGLAQSTVQDTARMSRFYGVFLGRVIQVNPANNSMDIRLNNGGTLYSVPLLRNSAGTREGEYGLPAIVPPKPNVTPQQASGPGFGEATQGVTADTTFSDASKKTPEDKTSKNAISQDTQDDDADGQIPSEDNYDRDQDSPTYKKDTWVLVAYLQGNVRLPVALGFIYPVGTQMSIKDRQDVKDDRLDWLRRYSSDVYELYTRGGTYEEVFPDGTRLRIGKKAQKQQTQQAGNLSQTQAPMNAPAESGSSDDDDPDAMLRLGTGAHENLDNDKFEWKPKDESGDKEKWRRGAIVHPSQMRLYFDEKGRVHIQNYGNKDSEDSPPPDGDSVNQFQVAHTDFHQTRLWRAAFGDPHDPPTPEDSVIDGEHWHDPSNKRVRYHLPEVSDGTFHQCNCGSGSGGSAGAGGSPSGMFPLGGFGAGSGFMQSGSYGVENFPVHQGEKYFQNQVGQSGGLVTDSNGKYFPAATTDGHAVSVAQVHHDNSPYAVDIMTGPNGRFIAPTSGYVTSMPVGGAGNLVTLHGDDGFDYHGGHVSALTSGRVTAGTAIGQVAPLGSTAPFTGSLTDGLHIHYLVTGRGQPPSPDGGGTVKPYYGTAGVAGLSATVDAHGGQNGSPPGTVGAVNDPSGHEDNPTVGTDPEAVDSTEGMGGEENQQTKWYMPAATPKGGGVQGKVQAVKSKPTDDQRSEAGDTGSGSATGSDLQEDMGKEGEGGKDGKLIDAAAADHVHYAETGGDGDIQGVGSSNAGGSSPMLARADHSHQEASGSPSDRRLKTDFEAIRDVLPAISKIGAFRFKWNDTARSLGIGDDSTSLGLVAQEVQRYFPEAIYEQKLKDGETYYTLNYGRLVAVLFAGVQEITSRLDSIEARLDELNGPR